MKTSLRKYLSLVMVLCVAFVCLFAGVRVKAASYAKASFGEGKYLITTVFDGANYYLPATTTSSGPLAKPFTDVSTISEDHLWTVTASGTNYYIQNSEGKYLYTTNANNGVRVGDTQHEWKYDTSANSFKNQSTNRYLGIYNASNWRCYTTVNQSNYKESSTSFVFYKVNSSAPSINVSGSSYAQINEVVALTAETSNISGAATWNSSNTSVATVDQSGNVTAKAMGTTTITATIGEVEGIFEFSVYPTDGSELTIAEAIQVCEITGQTNCPYTYSTTGEIASIDTAYNSGYDNITVTISDEISSIKAYRMTGGAELNVGDEITVTGTLINYSGNTPEFIQGCTYEVVKTNDSIVAIKAALNDVAAYMSLGFKYTSTTTTKTLAATEAVVAAFPACDTSINMEVEVNNAATIGLDENIFNVTAVKGGNSNNVGLNKEGSIRLYASKADGDGNELTIATKNGAIIQSITVVFGTQKAAFTVNGVEGSAEVTEYSVNSTSVTLKNISTASDNNQTHFKSITLNVETEGEDSVTVETTEYSDVDFRIRCGVDKKLSNIEGVDSYGIKVSAAGKEVYYNEEAATSWGSDEDYLYVTIALGDILTTMSRSSVEFTVTAYVVVDGVTYESESSKTYSVAGLVSEYYNGSDETIKNTVASLYDLYDKEGLFA